MFAEMAIYHTDRPGGRSLRDLIVAALLAIALPCLPLRREGDRDLLAVEGEMLQTPFKRHSPSPAYAGVFDPGRKHSLLPAWAKNIPPAYFLNASRPPQREPKKAHSRVVSGNGIVPRGTSRRRPLRVRTNTQTNALFSQTLKSSLFNRLFASFVVGVGALDDP